VFPVSYFFQQAKYILSLATFVCFERFKGGVEMIRKRSDVILNFFEYSRAYVKLYLNFIILLLLRRIVVMT